MRLFKCKQNNKHTRQVIKVKEQVSNFAHELSFFQGYEASFKIAIILSHAARRYHFGTESKGIKHAW